MKNNKGFTLAEILGVITILGLLGLIVFPAVDKAIKEGKEDLYKVQVSNIEAGAIAWVAENVFSAPSKEGEMITLTLRQLKQAGKVDNEIINPKTKTLFPNDMLVTITKKSGSYKAEVLTETGSETDETEYNPFSPTLILNGSTLEYVELRTSGQAYQDPGVIAKNSEGEIITNDVVITITKDSNTVLNIPVTTIGTYTITYSVTSLGLTEKIVRTVIVRDSEPPVITIPSTTTISVANTGSYNLIDTITVSDISTYTVVADRTLPSVAGTYTITYTATDEYDNVSTARRTIIVE